MKFSSIQVSVTAFFDSLCLESHISNGKIIKYPWILGFLNSLSLSDYCTIWNCCTTFIWHGLHQLSPFVFKRFYVQYLTGSKHLLYTVCGISDSVFRLSSVTLCHYINNHCSMGLQMYLKHLSISCLVLVIWRYLFKEICFNVTIVAFLCAAQNILLMEYIWEYKNKL